MSMVTVLNQSHLSRHFVAVRCAPVVSYKCLRQCKQAACSAVPCSAKLVHLKKLLMCTSSVTDEGHVICSMQ